MTRRHPRSGCWFLARDKRAPIAAGDLGWASVCDGCYSLSVFGSQETNGVSRTRSPLAGWHPAFSMQDSRRSACPIEDRFKAQWLSWLERRPVTAEVTGSSPVWVVCCSIERQQGILAQLGEHLPYKQRVIGSSPIGPIIYECRTRTLAHEECRTRTLAHEIRLTAKGARGVARALSAKQTSRYICRCGSIGRAADL